MHFCILTEASSSKQEALGLKQETLGLKQEALGLKQETSGSDSGASQMFKKRLRLKSQSHSETLLKQTV